MKDYNATIISKKKKKKKKKKNHPRDITKKII